MLVSGPFGPVPQGSLLSRRAPRSLTAPVLGDTPGTPWLDHTREQLAAGRIVILGASIGAPAPVLVLTPESLRAGLARLPRGELVAVAQAPLRELRRLAGDAALVELVTVTRTSLIVWHADLDDFFDLARLLRGYRVRDSGDDAVASPAETDDHRRAGAAVDMYRADGLAQRQRPDTGSGTVSPVQTPASAGMRPGTNAVPGRGAPTGGIEGPGAFGRASPEVSDPVDERRFLGVVVTSPDGTPWHRGLPVGSPFRLMVRIGPPHPAGVVPATRAFPAGQLPRTDRGWGLVALATSDDLAIDDRARWLFLPPRGTSWSCDCPVSLFEHSCPPDARQEWLSLAAETPGVPCRARITVRVYYGAVLLQAVDIVVPVGADPDPPRGEIVYSRDPHLRDPEMHDHRGMSCHVGPSADGRHTLVVNNGYNRPVRVSFADRQGDTAAAALRHVLYDTQFHTDATPKHRNGPHGQPVKSAEEYLHDLRRLAGAGATVYRALLSDHGNEQSLRHWLDTEVVLTGAPPVIQVARSATSRVSVPWQALYTEPLVDGPDAADVCPSVWERGPGSAVADAPARCPHREKHDWDRGTICPFGFWGLANVLEHPPSSLDRILPRTTSATAPPSVVVAVNPTLRDHQRHLGRVSTLIGGRDLNVTTSWRELRSAAADGTDVLYFFGHGRLAVVDGLPTQQPALELGSEEWITPGRLGSWSATARWRYRRPLVILNGCGTGETLSDLLAGFVDAFVNSLRGAGVIATEIAVESRAAQYAMEAFLARMWAGDTAGGALRAVRWQLLSSGSVLGLAYTPHCDAFLTLPGHSTLTGDSTLTDDRKGRP
ncbi:hypothetical protein AMIS_39730 [Actinoplanes missouriensis 431]|uniref:CHAT domain-containing protein n=1 Tax=Actinoplanes missouriensis (strain ATCC 14538 / DSM 43046 / CBS 188.64 / JCM 3121 / NBRC 102363 / NCIMB 12654 / NRRL B-3342 / UNCC 431) TaxID=512565 RepID=I0H856_ACTM4|nr:CHAT domain-containing protein [Actinoplanes missouriensis]BAL89193.1 hypothetical protein AMIS_39730 [Actinoplanes missouriensis 431]